MKTGFALKLYINTMETKRHLGRILTPCKGLPGVQLLGSTAKNIAESCEISPYVTLKEKSTSPYFLRFQKFTFDLITVIHLFDCLKLSNNASFCPRRHS